MRPHTAPVEGQEAGIEVTQAMAADALGWLSRMLLIREFESTAAPLVASGAIPGGMHSAIGQEAVSVGVLSVLGPDDAAAASHRSHHVALAKGMDPSLVMAELFGKATGCAGGRGGHMHLADFAVGFDGSNGIVGAGLGIALGAAFAYGYRRDGHCAAGFFGDGGANTGRVWEFVNLAAAWRLPLIVVCENNGYAVETRIADAMAGESVAARAAGFGLPSVQVDGQDVAAVHAGRGPATGRRSSRLLRTGTWAMTSANAASTAQPRKCSGGRRTGIPSCGCASRSSGSGPWTRPATTSWRARRPSACGLPSVSPSRRPCRIRRRSPMELPASP
jgi:TPP-dependent pyruvate/acetoin dehydrogenase alpha subunit